MRAYFFGNMYLSSIQQGIQAGHVIAEMAVKYWGDQIHGADEGSPASLFHQWADQHKTMILLNGGYAENLQDLEAFFEGTLDEPGVVRLSEVYDASYSPYPFASFRESDEALNGAMTSFGVILTDRIYEGSRRKKDYRSMSDAEYILWRDHNTLIFDDKEVVYNEFEKQLMERIGKFRLAS